MINLLPPEIKNRYKKLSKLYLTIVIFITIAVSLILGGLSLMTYSIIQNNAINEKEAIVAQLLSSHKQNSAVIEKAAFIESRINRQNRYQEKKRWEELLEAIALSTPVNTRLTTTDINIKESKITLVGESADQRSIILFRDKLLADSHWFSKAEIITINDDPTATKLVFTISLNIGNANE